VLHLNTDPRVKSWVYKSVAPRNPLSGLLYGAVIERDTVARCSLCYKIVYRL